MCVAGTKGVRVAPMEGVLNVCRRKERSKGCAHGGCVCVECVLQERKGSGIAGIAVITGNPF